MWISNTAATAMMFPIGLSIVAHMMRTSKAQPNEVRRFALAMMLITSFASSVGGMGTPVGTPPNLILDRAGPLCHCRGRRHRIRARLFDVDARRRRGDDRRDLAVPAAG
jgi:hypothetical protein